MKEDKLKLRLLEADIKSAIINKIKLGTGFTEDSFLINELALNDHSRRVDLAIFNGKNFIAFEVKSEADSLVRLPGQISEYLKYFDKVCIVAASKHIDSILEKIPSNVGVWEVCDTKIKVRRKGRIRLVSNKLALLKLLKLEEIKWISRKHTNTVKNSDNKSIKSKAMMLSVSKIRKLVFSILRKRFNLTSEKFLFETKNRDVNSSDITLLSRYAYQREAKKSREDNEFELFQELEILEKNIKTQKSLENAI